MSTGFRGIGARSNNVVLEAIIWTFLAKQLQRRTTSPARKPAVGPSERAILQGKAAIQALLPEGGPAISEKIKSSMKSGG